MSQFPKTISGKAIVTADVANGGTLTLSYPSGTTRADWAAIDPASLQVNIGGQDTYKGAQVSVALGTTMVITNSSGVIWKAGQVATISAKQPVFNLVGLPQSNYDALPTKDTNTVYVTTSG
jgi:hypothetical protein